MERRVACSIEWHHNEFRPMWPINLEMRSILNYSLISGSKFRIVPTNGSRFKLTFNNNNKKRKIQHSKIMLLWHFFLFWSVVALRNRRQFKFIPWIMHNNGYMWIFGYGLKNEDGVEVVWKADDFMRLLKYNLCMTETDACVRAACRYGYRTFPARDLLKCDPFLLCFFYKK